MYIPKQFQEDDLTVLHNLMQRNNFATLVSVHSYPFAFPGLRRTCALWYLACTHGPWQPSMENLAKWS
jgi:predicted FMN-binding regulatory protein PaiB